VSNQTHELQWYELGPVSEIPIRGSRRVVIEDQKIGIFRTAADEVYAIEDSCPHKQGPLTQGIVHDKCVTCPLHNWVISLENGEAQGDDGGSVAVYPVQVDNGQLKVAVGKTESAGKVSARD